MSHSKFVVGAVCTATVVLLLLITQKDKQRQEGKETPTCRQSSSLLQAATTRRRSDTSQTGTICSMCWQVSLQLSSHLPPCEASRQSLVVVSAGQLGSPPPPPPPPALPPPCLLPGTSSVTRLLSQVRPPLSTSIYLNIHFRREAVNSKKARQYDDVLF